MRYLLLSVLVVSLVGILMVLSSMVPESFAEDKLSWDKNRPLTWDDFQGEPDYSDDWAYTQSFAKLDASWNFKKSGSGCNYKFTEVDATALFLKDESWVKEEEKDDRLSLQFHQVIFNIWEIHAQKFENELLNNTFPCPDGSYAYAKINEKTNEFFDKIYAESVAMQDLFVSESDYGINLMKHLEWNKKIRSLLDFKEEPVSKEPIVSNGCSFCDIALSSTNIIARPVSASVFSSTATVK